MSFWKWFSTKFHAHDWEVVEKIPRKVYKSSGIIGDERTLSASGVRYVLKCKVCGELKFKDCI